MIEQTFFIEVVATSLTSALAAESGGADRIELCSALQLGGITPSLGLIKEVCKEVRIPVHVLIRPREGDFCYSASELKVMMRDIHAALDAGAKGVVLGVLNEKAEVNTRAMQGLVKEASHAHIVFHRAIDVCAAPAEALETIADLGCHTVLSSGGAPTAVEGKNNLHAWATLKLGSLKIMAGAGLRPANLPEVFHTAIHWYHLSGSLPIPSAHPNVLFDVSRPETDRTIIRQVREWLDAKASFQ